MRMPPLRKPETLYSLSLTNITQIIEFHVRVTLNCSAIYIPTTVNLLKKIISTLPTSLATPLAQTALRCADDLCERSVNPVSPSILNILVASLIQESTVTFEIKTLFSYRLRQAVLDRLCGLKHLTTYYSLEYLHESFNTWAILQRYQSLENLRKVYLQQWCTDEIACLLGHSCPNLQVLDIVNSSSVTDKSVSSLIRCTKLKVLLISFTNIADSGYQVLLKKLPLLQRIGLCFQLNDIIGNIRRRWKTASSLLALKEYESVNAPDDNVFFMCPLLSNVVLHSPPVTSYSQLPRQVSSLTIQNLTIEKSVNEMITPSIVHLDLFGCGVTQQDIASIATLCWNLRILRLRLEENLRLVVKNQAPFRNLEQLDITNNTLALDILMVARKIRHVQIQALKVSGYNAGPDWTDTVVDIIWDRNPMQFLESFYISVRCTFSVAGVLRILRDCPRLQYLGNTGSWNIADCYIDKIKQIVKKQNLAIDIEN